MNERIKKLYTEASEWALHNYPPPVNPFEWEDLRSKKFAELIVRECMYQVADVRIENDFEPVGDAALVQALAGIKKYFGVEE
jgi:hypothetical protein